MSNAFKLIVGGSIGAQLIIAFAGIALAHAYTPAAFGEFGLYASIAALTSVVSGFRLDHVAFSESSEKRHSQYLSATLLIALSIAAIVTAALTAANSMNYFQSISPLTVFFFTSASSCYYLFGQFDLYSGKYQRFARTRIIQSTLYATIPLLLLLVFDQDGLIIGVICSLLLTCLYCAFLNKSTIAFDFKNIIKLISDKWRTAAGNTGTTLLQYSTPFAPVILGSGFAAQSEVGAYFLLTQMVAAPFALVRRSLLNYFNASFAQPEIAKTILKNNLNKIIIIISALAILSAILGLAIHLRGELILATILGEAWANKTYFLIPILVYFTLDAVLQPMTTLLPHWGAAKTMFKLELIRFILVYVVGAGLVYLLKWSFFQYSIYFFMAMIAVYLIEAFFAVMILRGVINGKQR